MNRLPGGPIVQVVVGDEPRHKELFKRWTHGLKDYFDIEFGILQESNDNWHPSEAAACALKAMSEMTASMVNMIANNSHATDYILTEDQYNNLIEDIRSTVQKHINIVTGHLHQDN